MAKKLKIAIVCWPTLGGSGAVAAELGLELANRGHRVHFIANDALFRLDDMFHKNITFHTVEDVVHPLFDESSVYVLSLANKIAEVCRRYDIDIIHTHYSVPHAAAAIMARSLHGTKAKVINTFHGTDVNTLATNLNLREVMSHAIKQCDGLTAVAKALAETARANYDLSAKQDIRVIYNWVDKQKFSPTQAKELRDLFANNKEKIIIHMSNFREVKRIQDVISVFRGILKTVPAKLLLIGDGPEQRIAHRLISRHKLINRVHVLGLQTNIARVLSVSDLFLLPSSSEGFSLAALESMSFGVPVISTKVGGMPEMIEHGRNGFLTEVGDTEGMITLAREVLGDKELHAKISRAAIKTVNEKFNSKKIVPQYEAYYYEVLNAKN